jgi:sugar lactone lactonase YvrE
MAIQEWHVTEPYLNLHCELGEGPYYEKATNTLRFVDIKKKQVHTVSLAGGPGSVKTLQLDVPVTVTADFAGQDPQAKILIGVKYGIAFLDRKTGQYEYITRFTEGEGNARIRSNDGAVDPHGRFWLGTMTDFGTPLEPEGTQPPTDTRYNYKASLRKPRVPFINEPTVFA